ncbi:MAG: hypothetical protein AAGC68_10125, partial [Verrucomicrobiota bacterium]
LPPGRIIDIPYRELADQPLETLRLIYAKGGYDPPHDLEERATGWLRRSKLQRQGKRHHYIPADFGLSREGIESEFAPYLERFPEM